MILKRWTSLPPLAGKLGQCKQNCANSEGPATSASTRISSRVLVANGGPVKEGRLQIFVHFTEVFNDTHNGRFLTGSTPNGTLVERKERLWKIARTTSVHPLRKRLGRGNIGLERPRY
jgi:hypothetical protein